MSHKSSIFDTNAVIHMFHVPVDTRSEHLHADGDSRELNSPLSHKQRELGKAPQASQQHGSHSERPHHYSHDWDGLHDLGCATRKVCRDNRPTLLSGVHDKTAAWPPHDEVQIAIYGLHRKLEFYLRCECFLTPYNTDIAILIWFISWKYKG